MSLDSYCGCHGGGNEVRLDNLRRIESIPRRANVDARYSTRFAQAAPLYCNAGIDQSITPLRTTCEESADKKRHSMDTKDFAFPVCAWYTECFDLDHPGGR